MSAAPRRVILLNDAAYINGGQAKVMVDSALGLQARGIDVHIYAGTGPIADELTDAQVPVHGLVSFDMVANPSKLRVLTQGIWNGPVASNLTEFLKGFDPADTIAHVHGWARSLSGSIAKTLNDSGIKYVYSMHEYSLACPNTAFLDYPRNQICERKALGIDCLTTNCDHRPYLQKLWRVGRQMGMRAGGWPQNLPEAIYLSEVQKQVMAPYLSANTRLHHLPNPIGITRSAAAQVVKNQRFVFVGRISAEKGPFLFAQAAKNAGVQACFVGDGPLSEQLQAAHPEAEFLGWQDSEGVQQALQTARASVMSSLCYETHGMSVYESLACGVPVIVGDRSAAKEAVQPGHNGLLFPMASVNGLADAMRKLKDDQTAGFMGQNAYDDYWKSPLGIDQHLDRLMDIYSTILSTP